jgi:hypothetical protein
MFGQMEGKEVPVVSNSVHNYVSVRDSSVRGSEADVNGIAQQVIIQHHNGLELP